MSSKAVASFAFASADLSESLAASCSTSGTERREGVSDDDMVCDDDAQIPVEGIVDRSEIMEERAYDPKATFIRM